MAFRQACTRSRLVTTALVFLVAFAPAGFAGGPGNSSPPYYKEYFGYYQTKWCRWPNSFPYGDPLAPAIYPFRKDVLKSPRLDKEKATMEKAGEEEEAAARPAATPNSKGKAIEATAARTAEPITLIALVKVNKPGVGTPSGTVTFAEGNHNLGTTPIDGSGLAQFRAHLPAGSHELIAVYNGDCNFSASISPAAIQKVVPITSTKAVASAGTPTAIGQEVVFTPLDPGETADIGASKPLRDEPANFTVRGPGLNPSGPTSKSNTAPALPETVAKTPTTMTITSTVNPATYGQSVSFTVKVSGAAAGTSIPSGSVIFKSGAAMLGSAALDASGQATLTCSTLAVGNQPITAIYSGDRSCSASTSAPWAQTVERADTTTSILLEDSQ